MTRRNDTHPAEDADLAQWVDYIADPRIDLAEAIVRQGEACKYPGLVQKLMTVGRDVRSGTGMNT